MEIEFEDGSIRNLLSPFVDIFDKDKDVSGTTDEVAEAVVAEPVETKTTEEVVEAEATVLDTDDIYSRPKEKEKETGKTGRDGKEKKRYQTAMKNGG